MIFHFLKIKWNSYFVIFHEIKTKLFNEKTALHAAVCKENLEIIKLLLHHKDINISIKNKVLIYNIRNCNYILMIFLLFMKKTT